MWFQNVNGKVCAFLYCDLPACTRVCVHVCVHACVYVCSLPSPLKTVIGPVSSSSGLICTDILFMIS